MCIVKCFRIFISKFSVSVDYVIYDVLNLKCNCSLTSARVFVGIVV